MSVRFFAPPGCDVCRRRAGSGEQRREDPGHVFGEGKGLFRVFGRAFRLAHVQADERDARTAVRHALEGKADDGRRVEPHAQLEQHGFALRGAAEKVVAPRGGAVPGGVLHEERVLADVHFHLAAAHGAFGHEGGGDAAVLLRRCHLPHERLVVVQRVVAAPGALQFAVVSLHRKHPFGGESRLFKLRVDVGRHHETVPPCGKRLQGAVQRQGGRIPAVAHDVARPVRPLFFLRPERVKPRRVHVRHAVFSDEIGKILGKAFAGIGQPGRRREPRAPADDYAVRPGQPFPGLSDALRLFPVHVLSPPAARRPHGWFALCGRTVAAPEKSAGTASAFAWRYGSFGVHHPERPRSGAAVPPDGGAELQWPEKPHRAFHIALFARPELAVRRFRSGRGQAKKKPAVMSR